ncbi:MAG: sulfide dehydrogenase [Pseudomonadota bacterium]
MSRRAAGLAAALVAAALPGGAWSEDTAVLAQACSGCHVAGGGAAIPAIAGRDAGELAELLLAYRNDTAEGTIMNRLAKGYTEAELRALATHFAEAGR